MRRRAAALGGDEKRERERELQLKDGEGRE
jgi:hypothetical protein